MKMNVVYNTLPQTSGSTAATRTSPQVTSCSSPTAAPSPSWCSTSGRSWTAPPSSRAPSPTQTLEAGRFYIHTVMKRHYWAAVIRSGTTMFMLHVVSVLRAGGGGGGVRADQPGPAAAVGAAGGGGGQVTNHSTASGHVTTELPSDWPGRGTRTR